MLNKGIKAKLVFSLVVTTLLLMSLFFIILDRYLKDYSISETNKTVFFLGQNAALLLEKPLFINDYNQLKNIVQPIILKDFDYLVIFDNMSRNVAFKEDVESITDSFEWDTLLNKKEKFERTDLNLVNGRYTQYVFPITAPGVVKPLGYLIIGISEGKMKSKLVGITIRIAVVSILLFLTLTLTIYFLSNKIVEPIKALSYDIGRFASGNFAVRSNINTKDEIGNLSYNFNFMANKINEQIVSIEEYSKNLEKRVEERTIELLRALDAIKEKDSRLNQAEKINSLNAIVTSIAHEINNPMAIISGNLQMLTAKLEGNGDEKIKKRLETAQMAVDRISTLIDDINFFSAIKDVYTASLSFSGVLQDVVQKIVPSTVKLHIDNSGLKPEEEQIVSNSHLLSVALENVLKNSVEIIHHLGISGKLNIHYFKDSPYFVVEMTDNAGGIKEISKVFDPFYTTFNEKKGLGLTFVYHALQALNGQVHIANIQDAESGEKGVKVTFMLPIEIEREEESVSSWLP